MANVRIITCKDCGVEFTYMDKINPYNGLKEAAPVRCDACRDKKTKTRKKTQ